MKTILAAGALLLPAALAATDTLFGSVTDPACGPCVHAVVAKGPGSVQSQEFAKYLCMGKGGDAIASCILDCGTLSPSDDVLDIAYASAQRDLIVGAVFDYCYTYYPVETCKALKDYFGGAVDKICAGVGQGTGTGGSNNSPTSAAGTTVKSSTAKTSSPATRTAATGTAAAGTAEGTGTGTGTAATGTAATGSAATGTTATGSQQTPLPNSTAAANARAPWEMLVGLVILALTI